MSNLPDDLKYPDKAYLKFQMRGDVRLGYMTPYDENDEKFKNRKKSVDSWARSRTSLDDQSILDRQGFLMHNEPATGFRLGKVVSRSQTENKVWRIEDPRGFWLEIMSENLNFLLDHVDITDRTMSGELVWTTRLHGGTNWLIPADHEAFEEIKEFTNLRKEARADRVSLRDVNRGDIVLLHDGRRVRYLGGLYAQRSNGRDPLGDIDRNYYFEVLAGKPLSHSGRGSGLDSKSSIKVGKVVEGRPISDEEAEDIANAYLEDRESLHWKMHRRAFFRANSFNKSDYEIEDGRAVFEDGRSFKIHFNPYVSKWSRILAIKLH